MSNASAPAPKAQIPWVWLSAAILATTCLVCPSGIGLGWWLGSGRGPAVSSSVPNEGMARKAIEERYKKDVTEGYIRILRVRKTDGASMEVFGVKRYSMECEIEVEFLKNWDCPEDRLERSLKSLQCVQDNADYRNYSKGERIVYKRHVTFDKSENGWNGH